MTKNKDESRISARLSKELFEEVKRLAEKNRRSLNFMFNELLEQAVSQVKKEGEQPTHQLVE